MTSEANGFAPLVAAVQRVETSEHVCMSYRTTEEALAAIVPFLRRGVDLGERCIVIADGVLRSNILAAMRSDGIPVDAALQRGALAVLGAGDSYSVGGSFDPERMLDWIRDRARIASAAGFPALRIVGDMICVVGGPDVDVEQLAEFEAKVNYLLADEPIAGLCLYDRRQFGPDVIREMIATHPVVVAGAMVCDNPFFVPPDEYLASDWAKREIEWVLKTLAEMERARKELGGSEARYRMLSRRLLDLQEAERRSVARDLHDHLGQILTGIKISLHAMGRGRRRRMPTPGTASARAEAARTDALAMIDDAIQEVRNLTSALRPPLLDDLGVAAALRWYVARQAQRGGLESRLDVKGMAAARFRPAVELACFRLVQESITNVLRHAQARLVEVKLAIRDGAIEVVVRDDGIGFDVNAARTQAAAGGGLGLLGMEERVAIAGGRLRIESVPGQGTTIRARLPLERPPSSA